MIVKPHRDRGDDLSALMALAARADCTARTRAEIDVQMRKIRAGTKGEGEAAYAIDFSMAGDDRWAVIHDLRLEWQGRVAQIDHLLVNRMLDIWLCETKHFGSGVAINEHGEFTTFFQNRSRGIESPIEQNHRHRCVLESVLGSSILPLPTRLGVAIRPTIRSVVLVGAEARITRPTQVFDGLETVIKVDQLRPSINRSIDAMGVGQTLLAVGKIVSADTLREFATSLARLHRPLKTDWAARFGMAAVAAVAAVAPPEMRQASMDARPSSPANATPPHTGPTAPAKLSTSKLAAALGISSARAMLERLTEAGLLVVVAEGHALTEAGRAAGGELIEKSRYGPYFVWPASLRVSERSAARAEG